MPGRAVTKERMERWAELREDPVFAQACVDRIADGDSYILLAADAGVPYGQFVRWLKREHGPELADARAARAQALADRMAENADKVDLGLMPAKNAQVSSNIRQWLATRYDPETFGDRSKVDMTLKGAVEMNLAAIRALTARTIDGEYEEVGRPCPGDRNAQTGSLMPYDPIDDDDPGYDLDDDHPLI